MIQNCPYCKTLLKKNEPCPQCGFNPLSYDRVLDTFLNGKSKLVKIEISRKGKNLDPNQVMTYLNYQIKERKLDNIIKALVINNITYLETVNSKQKMPIQDTKMNSSELKEVIRKMNTGVFGSFCEYVIYQELIAKGILTVKSHGELKDLIVKGLRVDVKGHRCLSNKEAGRFNYSYKVFNTEYIHIVFLSEKAIYYEENNKYTGELDYVKLNEYWLRWPYEKKNQPVVSSHLKEVRDQKKKEVTVKLSKSLGYPVHVVYRGSEITRGKRQFPKPPSNFSLTEANHTHALVMVYIQFKETFVDRAVALKVEDVLKRLVPKTFSWGSSERINKEIIDVDKLWNSRDAYSNVFFFEGTSLNDLIDGIIGKFGN